MIYLKVHISQQLPFMSRLKESQSSGFKFKFTLILIHKMHKVAKEKKIFFPLPEHSCHVS